MKMDASPPSKATRIAAAFLALLLLPVRAPAAGGIDVRLRRNDDKTYEVHGMFEVAASSPVVWSVLADYEGIPGFVYSMKRSAVRERRPDGTVVLDQEAVGGLFLLSRKVRIVLEVRRAPERMDFLDVGGEDFLSYAGSWQTQASGTGTLVSYDLRADPRFPAPGFVMKGVMRRGALNLLEQVRDEIVRRARAAEPGPVKDAARER